MINFPIAIVLYNPTDAAVKRILHFLDCGVVLYIFDNSILQNEILSNSLNPNLNYFSFNKNLGLSFSLDFLCKAVVSAKYENLLFFDQDTIFTVESLVFIENFINKKNSADDTFFEDVLLVNFRDCESRQSNLNILETYHYKDYLMHSVYFNINSGTLYFLDKFNNFKWFEEEYFVDGVDYALSLNAIINSLKSIVIINVPGLNHKDEQGDSLIVLFGKNIYGRIYPLNRNIDYVSSQLRLLNKTFKVKGYKPKFFILKGLFGYIATQFIFRIKNMFVKIN